MYSVITADRNLVTETDIAGKLKQGVPGVV